jgi:hypothetical protein
LSVRRGRRGAPVFPDPARLLFAPSLAWEWELLRTLLRLCAAITLAYWLGCLLMVAATPKAHRYDCHGKTRQDCLEELIQSRRAKDPNRHKPWWRVEQPSPRAAAA